MILGAVFLCMSTALFAGVAVKDATNTAAAAVSERFSSGFRLQSSAENVANTFKGEGIIPQAAIDTISAIDGVERSTTQVGAMANLPEAELVSLEQYSEQDERLTAKYGTFTQLEAVSDTSRESKFALGTLTLESGRHIGAGDVHEALVHEAFATLNDLAVGDTFTVAASALDRGNKYGSEASVTVTVAGTFSGTSVIGTGTRQDLFENIVLTDLATVWDLYGLTQDQHLYSAVDFTLSPGHDVDTVLAEAKRLPIDWNRLDVIRSDRDLAGVASSADGILGMVDTLIWVTIVFSVLILTLFLFLWLHGRRREAGVMFSVGIGRGRVLAQFVCELALVGVVAFGLAAVTGGAVAQAIGDAMASRATQSVRQDILTQTGGMLAADADTAATLKTIDTITVQPTLDDLVWVYLIGLSVIVVAVLVSSMPLLRARPRDLLARMK
nr:ABC transporter permease [Pseudactinotalea sp. HY160]